MTLRRKAYTSVRWTTLATIARALLQLVQVAVLARLLSPEDYGLMALVGVVLTVAGVLTDVGLNSAYVQKQDVTTQQRSSLFWCNILMSAALALAVAAGSPLFAWLFEDARLIPLLMFSASTFLINAFGQQFRSTAEKNLNFRPLALIETTAAFVGFGLTVLAAVNQLGVYSLVLGNIATSFASTSLSWLFLAGEWRPARRLKFEDLKPFLGFGGAIVGNSIANQINVGLDLFIGGLTVSASQLGLYSVPRNLVLQLQFTINPIVTRVGFPLISQVQHDLPRVREIYLKTLNMTASINAPLYLGIAFYSPEVIQLLLGPNWDQSAVLLRILALWGLLRSTINPVGSLLMGMGKAKLSFKWNIVQLFIVPPLLCLGSYFGARGLAWALLGLTLILYLPVWYLLVRPLCNLTLTEYAIAVFKPILIALLTVATSFIISSPIKENLFRMTIGSITAAIFYLVVSYSANREWCKAVYELMTGKQISLSRKS